MTAGFRLEVNVRKWSVESGPASKLSVAVLAKRFLRLAQKYTRFKPDKLVERAFGESLDEVEESKEAV